MKKGLFACFLSMIVLFQSVSSTTVVALKNDTVKFHERVGENIEDCTCSVNPMSLICTNEENREYSHGSVIKKHFEIKSCYDVDEYEIILSSFDGVDILKEPTYAVNNNGINTVDIEFKVLDSCEIGNICFKLTPVLRTDDSITNPIGYEQNIYCYHDMDNDYVSTVYLDCLSEYSEKLKNYLLNIDRQGEYIEKVNQDADTIKGSDGITRYSHAVSGYISWTDSAGGIHAADGIKVELCDALSGTGLGSMYTTAAGGYSLSFTSSNSNQNVKIKVYSEGSHIVVNNYNPPYGTYTYVSSAFNVSGYTKFSYTASNSTNCGQSISIQQAMALAHNFILNYDSNDLNSINVYFPNGSTNSCFMPSSVGIYIKQGHQFEWDTLQHEYGHYVQYCYGISDSPGGPHNLDDNLADSLHDKSAGVKLAWGEGWPTYFAIKLQEIMSASSLLIPHVGDSHYQDYSYTNPIDVDLESPISYYFWKGEANEVTVSAILYDMTDGIDLSEDDNVSFTYDFVWNLIKTNHCTTLSSFIGSYYSSSTSNYNKLALGSTLSRYNVAAEPNNPSSSNPPTFSWLAQGGSSSYPNDSFILVFINANYSTILAIPTNNTSVQLTSTQWAQIQNATYYYVETYQTNTDLPTGPYKSRLKTL